jgi:segregation and condensation protein A
VGGTRVETFLAVLFLAHRGTVSLEQDDLFGDLWVQNARGGAENENGHERENQNENENETGAEDDGVAAD